MCLEWEWNTKFIEVVPEGKGMVFYGMSNKKSYGKLFIHEFNANKNIYIILLGLWKAVSFTHRSVNIYQAEYFAYMTRI